MSGYQTASSYINTYTHTHTHTHTYTHTLAHGENDKINPVKFKEVSVSLSTSVYSVDEFVYKQNLLETCASRKSVYAVLDPVVPQ